MMKQSHFLFIFLFSFLGVEMNAVTSDVAVSMRVPAEYLVMTLTIESSEKTVEKREAAILIGRQTILDSALSSEDLKVFELPQGSQHRPYFKSSKLSSLSFAGGSVAPQAGLSRMSFEVRADLGEGVVALEAVRRVRGFAEALKLSSKTRKSLADAFDVRVGKPESFRAELLKRIAADVSFLRKQFDRNAEVTLSGLEQPVRQRRVGPLEVELFIPYTLTFGLKGEQESGAP